MDISVDEHESDGNRPSPFFTVLRTIRGIPGWLAEFFTLTEEENVKAGIYLGGQGRDD
jgi:hypothetical protein